MKAYRDCKGPCACSGWCLFKNDEDFNARFLATERMSPPCNCVCHRYPQTHNMMACVLCGHKNNDGVRLSFGWLSHRDIDIVEARQHWNQVKSEYPEMAL